MIRVWVLRMPLGAYDSDEAIWTLMARHVFDGELPVYFWGQGYAGTLEVYVSAPLSELLGGGIAAARVVMLLLDVAAVALVWLVGRRVLDGTRPGRGSAVLDVARLRDLEGHAYPGVYVSGQILGLLVIYLVLRLAERPSLLDALSFGVVVGLMAWQTLQVLPTVLVALAWLAWRRPGAYRLAWIAVPGVVLGSGAAGDRRQRPQRLVVHLARPRQRNVPVASARVLHDCPAPGTGRPGGFSLDWLLTAPVGFAVTAGVCRRRLRAPHPASSGRGRVTRVDRNRVPFLLRPLALHVARHRAAIRVRPSPGDHAVRRTATRSAAPRRRGPRDCRGAVASGHACDRERR